MTVQGRLHEADWLEASARERLSCLLDTNTFVEFVGPEQRVMSPHLSRFDLTAAFDDGVVVGRGLLAGQPVFVAAQEGRFLGGAFGEVHGAKFLGLLRAAVELARSDGPNPVLLLLDTGGVRLQEANAGELAISEIINAVIEARLSGIPVVALIGGRAGAFGGGSIITACCSRVIVSEHGRISVSGPEVIETNKGVEEFDSKDRALVWRITGGRTRFLMGGADAYVKTNVGDFRQAAISMIANPPPFSIEMLEAEHRRLSDRVRLYGDCRDGPEIWARGGLPTPDAVTEVSDDAFERIPRLTEAGHDAR